MSDMRAPDDMPADDSMGRIEVYRPDPPAKSFDQTLAALLADQDRLTPEKLDMVLKVRRELMADRARESFQIAFADMATKLPQVEKHGMVELINKQGEDKGSYRYARWEDMDTVIRPILSAHGFSIMFQEFTSDKGQQMLRGRLMHVEGHVEVSERPIRPDPGPGRNETQAWGSGLSYAKRYTAELLCNIVRKGVDDDAISTDEKLTEAEADDIHELLIQTMPQGQNIGEYTTRFLHAMLTGIEQVADIPRRDFPRLKNALANRQRQQQEKT